MKIDDLEGELRKTIITDPTALRAVLLLSIEKVVCGQMSVPQANAVVGLSAEVHKSIKAQYDMTVFAMQELGMQSGTNLLAIEKVESALPEEPDDAEG
jgi:hypothetical protein